MAGFPSRGITATVMPGRVRAMHVPTTPEKQRATMERKESNYVYVAFCIHIDRAVMGTSLCDCAFIYIFIYVGVLDKTVENFCSSIV